MENFYNQVLSELLRDHAATMTLSQAGAVLGVDFRTVKEAIKRGQIESVTVGTKERVLTASLVQMITPSASDNGKAA